jgi:hypothetical protein
MTCSGSCITFLESLTKTALPGAFRPPTAEGFAYPLPANRWEEREAFRFRFSPGDVIRGEIKYPDRTYLVKIYFDEEKHLHVETPEGIVWLIKSTTLIGGVWDIDQESGLIKVNQKQLDAILADTVLNEDGGRGIFVVMLKNNPSIPIPPDEIFVGIPWGYESLEIMDPDHNIIVIIQERLFGVTDHGYDK